MHAFLKEKLARLPDSPGVYLHKDKQGRVLYVGKASNLRSRVRSYFQASGEISPKIRWMVSRVADVETILVDSELEALILECNLIKKYRPYFNVKYRDDKRYPLLMVTTGEEFPTLKVVRKPRNDRHRYFGPYPDAGALRRTIKILQRVFQLRTCKIDMKKPCERPCLDYYIELCTAPCTRFVNGQQYRAQVDQAIAFLEGHSDALLERLRQEMKEESEKLNFERCARLRDMVFDLERIAEKQKVVSRNRADHEDYVALDSRRDLVAAHVLQVREGKLVGQNSFFLDSHGEADAQQQISAFLKEYYGRGKNVPRRVLVSHEPYDSEVLTEWLAGLVERKVELRKPQRGQKKKLLDLCRKNAGQALELESATPSRFEARRKGLHELRQALGLEDPPWRIECVDISNTQGKEAVGSLVVFDHGMPKKDQYRRFRIRSGDTPDDYRMMREVLTRRFSKLDDQRAFASLPELLVVDGGKGQLGVAVEVLTEKGLRDQVPVVGLAKEHEWLFAPGRKEPIVLQPGSKGLSLVTHLRDEAHRFAITYHRKLRKKQLRRSTLDQAPGIGEGRKKKLLERFGSLSKLLEASPEQLSEVEGIGPRLAGKLYDYLHSATAASSGPKSQLPTTSGSSEK